MKRILMILSLVAASASGYERLQGPTELLFHNPEKAFEGYTLFGVGSRTYLLDMEGRVVHTWPLGTNPHLLDNGNILDASKDDPSGFQGFKEVDWDGNTVWEYTEKREGFAPHHDWVRIHNKKIDAPTTLYIANRSITHEQAIAAGADPAKGPYRDGQMDAVVEVDMQGNVVWEWWFFDHVVQDVDPAKPNYVGAGKTVADYPGRININMPGRPLKRDWLHCNSLDYNSESGHIVINSVQGELYVIDHDGTFVANDSQASILAAASPAGDFLYRFGDPARYGQGDPPRVLENWDSATSGHKQMGGSHDAHWVAPGLPGAGHIMVFNNGQYLFERTPHSSVLEINPFLDAVGRETGKYVNPPDAGYRREEYDKDTHNVPRQISNQIVYSYQSVNSHGFFSHIGSSGQRLPNGNLFVCSDTEGHFFEVTDAGELAWEYINPVTREGAVKVLGDALPMVNSAFRAYRYSKDHPAFAGRDLTPKGTITERAEAGLDPQPKRRPPSDPSPVSLNNQPNRANQQDNSSRGQIFARQYLLGLCGGGARRLCDFSKDVDLTVSGNYMAPYTNYNNAFPNDPPIFANGIGGGSIVYAMREGIERFFITDINNPAGSALAQSSLAIMHDGIDSSTSAAGVLNTSAMVARFSHIPGGANVLYMDGHVEFIKYPGKYPITKAVAVQQPSAGAVPSVVVQAYITANGGIPAI